MTSWPVWDAGWPWAAELWQDQAAGSKVTEPLPMLSQTGSRALSSGWVTWLLVGRDVATQATNLPRCPVPTFLQQTAI